MTTTTLDFTVHPITSPAELREACAVRAAAYGHHMPEIGQRLFESDALDRADGTAVLLAIDKETGRGIGTARIQSSAYGTLPIEDSVELPEWLTKQPRAEITRLAVVPGADPLTKLALMKAAYLYCLASQQRWLVIGARNQALLRNYRRLGFVDALGHEQHVRLPHAGNLPHRILAFDVVAAERNWQAQQHPLYAFMVQTFHPDLQLFHPRRAQRSEHRRETAAA